MAGKRKKWDGNKEPSLHKVKPQRRPRTEMLRRGRSRNRSAFGLGSFSLSSRSRIPKQALDHVGLGFVSPVPLRQSKRGRMVLGDG
ncbi:hypothetical protein Droror1_Dr00027622 [Drosera rotundifolia]